MATRSMVASFAAKSGSTGSWRSTTRTQTAPARESATSIGSAPGDSSLFLSAYRVVARLAAADPALADRLSVLPRRGHIGGLAETAALARLVTAAAASAR